MKKKVIAAIGLCGLMLPTSVDAMLPAAPTVIVDELEYGFSIFARQGIHSLRDVPSTILEYRFTPLCRFLIGHYERVERQRPARSAIVVDPAYWVVNGFLGMGRNVGLRLIQFMIWNARKVQVVLGMSQESATWKNHPVFRILRFKLQAELPPTEKDVKALNEEYCYKNNEHFSTVDICRESRAENVDAMSVRDIVSALNDPAFASYSPLRQLALEHALHDHKVSRSGEISKQDIAIIQSIPPRLINKSLWVLSSGYRIGDLSTPQHDAITPSGIISCPHPNLTSQLKDLEKKRGKNFSKLHHIAMDWRDKLNSKKG